MDTKTLRDFALLYAAAQMILYIDDSGRLVRKPCYRPQQEYVIGRLQNYCSADEDPFHREADLDDVGISRLALMANSVTSSTSFSR